MYFYAQNCDFLDFISAIHDFREELVFDIFLFIFLQISEIRENKLCAGKKVSQY